MTTIDGKAPLPVAWRVKQFEDSPWMLTPDKGPTGNWRFFEPLYTAPSPVLANEGVTATHRHKKRGSEYVLIDIGKMQTDHWVAMVSNGQAPDRNTGELIMFPKSVDMREVAIYRSVDDGSLWVRPREEFEDGRFEPLPTPPALTP